MRAKTLKSTQILYFLKIIPKGKVASYGQIANLAGHPGAARQVAWLLHSCSRKYRLPWHRVINFQGKISLPRHMGHLNQKAQLFKEGVEMDELCGRIDMSYYQWKPSSAIIQKCLREAKKQYEKTL